jgi:hypothetical protein
MTQAFNLSQFANSVNTSGQASLTTGVTGTLPIANGGTNNGSLAVTAGGVVYTDGSKLANIGAGTSGQVLTSAGSSSPTWATLSAGGNLVAITAYTSSGTWTKSTNNPSRVVVMLCGGGGGGGSANNGPGNTGGTSSFGSHCSATGGEGGYFNSGNTANGGSGSGGNVNISGGYGVCDCRYLGTVQSTGGISAFGLSGNGGFSNNYNQGSTNSAGGGGGGSMKLILAASLGSTETVTVGNGGSVAGGGAGIGGGGIVIVYEYS